MIRILSQTIFLGKRYILNSTSLYSTNPLYKRFGNDVDKMGVCVRGENYTRFIKVMVFFLEYQIYSTTHSNDKIDTIRVFRKPSSAGSK